MILFIFTVVLLDLRVTDPDLVIAMATVVGQEDPQVNLVVKRVEHLLITNLPSG